jgi:hypothetical protein
VDMWSKECTMERVSKRGVLCLIWMLLEDRRSRRDQIFSEISVFDTDKYIHVIRLKATNGH